MYEKDGSVMCINIDGSEVQVWDPEEDEEFVVGSCWRYMEIMLSTRSVTLYKAA